MEPELEAENHKRQYPNAKETANPAYWFSPVGQLRFLWDMEFWNLAFKVESN
jgi:hypothetical protein